MATTRELLFTFHGYTVTTALGRDDARTLCSTRADLLVLGHSVPQEEKREIVKCFRQYNHSPVLSLLHPGQSQLPEVEYAVEHLNPRGLVSVVDSIIRQN